MNTAVRRLQDLFGDPRHARSVRFGGGALGAVLLAGLAWVAWANGGTRLDETGPD